MTVESALFAPFPRSPNQGSQQPSVRSIIYLMLMAPCQVSTMTLRLLLLITRVLRVDQAAERLARLGPGSLLFKLDVKSAYRAIPIHPDDRLLAYHWAGLYFVDGCAPFGMRSSPILWEHIGNAIVWILSRENIPDVERYVDDFLVIIEGALGVEGALRRREEIRAVFARLGIPLAMDKLRAKAYRLLRLSTWVFLSTPCGWSYGCRRISARSFWQPSTAGSSNPRER